MIEYFDIAYIAITLSSICLLTSIYKEKRILGARWNSVFFAIFFFIIAPINENINNIVYYNGKGNTDLSFAYSCLIILLFSILLLLSIFTVNSNINARSNRYIDISKFKMNLTVLQLAPWIFGIIYLYLMGWEYGYLTLREPVTEIEYFQINYLIADRFIRPGISIFNFILLNSSLKKLNKFIALCSLLIFSFPTSTPRFITVFIYLPFILLLFDSIVINKLNRILITTFILFALPMGFIISNYFRSLDYLKNIFDDNLLEVIMNTGHLDSFQSLQNTIDYVNITSGKQLIGSILFFIPRYIWPTKPVGSSSVMADSSGLSWNNIGMSLFSEGYINFGIFGVIIFSFIFVYFATKNDTMKHLNYKNIIFRYYFPGSIFIILRGDLTSAFTLIFPMIFFNLFFNLIIKK
ncbi:oligosaccharide repeat unit polymerase [Polynucleobacter paneuropaeus]|nr:oligosaccharide repeat unit polymerase [Polynucleobacter paneuropaeus]